MPHRALLKQHKHHWADCSGGWKTDLLSCKKASTTCDGSGKLAVLDGLVHLASSLQSHPERCSSCGCNGNAAIVWRRVPELAALGLTGTSALEAEMQLWVLWTCKCSVMEQTRWRDLNCSAGKNIFQNNRFRNKGRFGPLFICEWVSCLVIFLAKEFAVLNRQRWTIKKLI